MSRFRFHALKSRHGDCLLVRSDETTILVDGGPAGVYRDFLKPHLEALQAQKGITDPLFIDLLLVSHIDEDHVLGLVDLTREMIQRQADGRPQLVRFGAAWFNSFADSIAHVAGEPEEQVGQAATQVAAMANKSLSLSLGLDNSLIVISSVSQGRQLRQALNKLNIPVNQPFNRGLVLNEREILEHMVGDIKLRVVGPGEQQLEDLRQSWKKQLPDILDKERGNQATAMAAADLDDSVFNLASIAVVAEHQGGRMLLTGDARGDMIIDWLKDQDELDETGRAHFNILKLPHHGSTKNIPKGFFRTITADHYVISGNGRFGNPEPDVMHMLFDERGLDQPYLVHLTYGLEEMDERKEFDKNDFERVLGEFPGSNDRLRLSVNQENMISIEI